MALFKIESQNIANDAIAVAQIDDTAYASLTSSANTAYALAISVSDVANTIPRISGVQIANSSYVILDDTAANTSGGYVVISGSGFVSGCQVIIGDTLATSVSFVSSGTLHCQVPAKSAATYNIFVINPNGSTAIGVNGLTYSATPTWVTASSLSQQTINVAFTITLSATGATSYALANGSSLPAGVSLVSNGYVYGTVTGIAEATTYNFSVIASDDELQDSTRAFSFTVNLDSMWIRRIGSNTSTGKIVSGAITLDDSYNIYVGLASYKEGSDATTTSSPLFLKYDSTGSLQWKKYFNISGAQTIEAATIVDSNVYFAGITGNAGTGIYGTVSTSGYWKLNPNGTGYNYVTINFYTYSNTYGNWYYGPFQSKSMTYTANTFGGSGNVVITAGEVNWDGYDSSHFTFSNPVTEQKVMTYENYYNSGSQLCVEEMVTHPLSNYVYMVSSGKGNYTYGTTSNNGTLSIYKFNTPDSSPVATLAGYYTLNPANFTSLALDASSNTVYCIGETTEDTGSSHPLIVKFTNNNTLSWAKSFRTITSTGSFGTQSAISNYETSASWAQNGGTKKLKIRLDNDGNIYAAFTNQNSTAIINIIKLNSSGNILWSRSLTTTGTTNRIVLNDFIIKDNYIFLLGTGHDGDNRSYALLAKILKSGGGTGTYGDIVYSTISDPTISDVSSWSAQGQTGTNVQIAATGGINRFVGNMTTTNSSENTDIIL